MSLYSASVTTVLSAISSHIFGQHHNDCHKVQQEGRLKRRNTLGGLEISIRHQIVNTLELSAVLPHQIEVSPPPPSTPTHPPTHKKVKKKKVKTLQHGNLPGEVSNNKYICSSKKQDYYSLHVHLHSVCSIFQRMFCLYLFLVCRPLITFTNFIKSLSLLVTFLLNFRHGLSRDLSHVHLSIYKRLFYQEFQQISK